jgi:hypothetical protein
VAVFGRGDAIPLNLFLNSEQELIKPANLLAHKAVAEVIRYLSSK